LLNSIKTNINSTKFLCLIIDNTVSWKDHIAALTSKLNKACYAIRAIKPFMSVYILRVIYFSYVHSVMSYGIIFGGNSHHSNSIFKIQKRIIKIITNTVSLDSCHQLFSSYKYFHFHINTFSHYLFLLTRIEIYFNPILKFMI